MTRKSHADAKEPRTLKLPTRPPSKPRAKKIDPGPVVQIAVSATEFATVNEYDWGHAYFHGEWTNTAKGPKCKGLVLGRFIADRMGLDRTIAVAYRDGNPLNCTRANVFVTIYVWVQATIKRSVVVENEKGVEEQEWRESPGWTYGNVGLTQGVVGGSTDWHAIHLTSGLGVNAWWSSLKKAKAGIEAIHAEMDFGTLEHYATFKESDARKWREAVRKYRG